MSYDGHVPLADILHQSEPGIWLEFHFLSITVTKLYLVGPNKHACRFLIRLSFVLFRI